MRIVAVVGGIVVVAGLIVLAVAGLPAATAVLVTVAALFVMVVLGGQMGGRHTPNVRPVPTGSTPSAADRAAPGAPVVETPDAGGSATAPEPIADG